MKVHHMSLQPFVEMPSLELGSSDSCHQGLFVRKFRGAPKCTLHQSVFMERTNRVATRTGCLFSDFCSQNCLRSHQRPVVANIVGRYMQWISIAVCCCNGMQDRCRSFAPLMSILPCRFQFIPSFARTFPRFLKRGQTFYLAPLLK